MSVDAYQRFASIIEHVSYRDWRWRLGQEGPEGHEHYWLQVEFDAPHSMDLSGPPIVQRGRKWLLSEHMTRSEVVQTCWAAVQMAIEHEAREDFRYRGEAVFGPHFDVDRLFAHMTQGLLSPDVRAA